MISVASAVFFFLCCQSLAFATSAESTEAVKQIIDVIKGDSNNHSFTQMLDQTVMPQYSLGQHAAGAPYFFTNDRLVISKIVSEVVTKPDGVVKTAQGHIEIFRVFDFRKDLAHFFKKEVRLPHGFDGRHLGVSSKGPTNNVSVIIKNLPGKMPEFIQAYPS